MCACDNVHEHYTVQYTANVSIDRMFQLLTDISPLKLKVMKIMP